MMPDREMSRAVLFESTGLTIEDYILPPFCLRAGEGLCVHVAAPSPWWQDNLVPVLTGDRPRPELVLHGSVSYLERPRAERRWWRGLANPTVADWLVTAKGLQMSEATRALERVGLPCDIAVGSAGWNERTLLAFEAWFARPTNALVFDTAGNDPRGEQRVMERVASRPECLTLIYLKTSASTLCLPGGTCIGLTRRTLQPTNAE
jgi:hypothetical protein